MVLGKRPGGQDSNGGRGSLRGLREAAGYKLVQTGMFQTSMTGMMFLEC